MVRNQVCHRQGFAREVGERFLEDVAAARKGSSRNSARALFLMVVRVAGVLVVTRLLFQTAFGSMGCPRLLQRPIEALHQSSEKVIQVCVVL